MKIKNLEDLQDKIDKELSWRRKELVQIKFNVSSTTEGTFKSDFALRSGVILLYADWEGFIRNISNYYVIYVFSRKYKGL